MKNLLTELRLAIAFLTRIPVGNFSAENTQLARSMAFFPAVGLFLGLLLVMTRWLLTPWLPVDLVDLILVTLLALLSGGLHLDGLADVADGLSGGHDPQSRMRIMKDSSIGAHGALALILLLFLKVSALQGLGPEVKDAALVLMPTAGRWLQVTLALFAPYARNEGGTAAPFVAAVSERELLGASATLLVAALFLVGMAALSILLVLAALVFLARRYFMARLGGVTGDVLGAVCEIGEVLLLLTLIVLF